MLEITCSGTPYEIGFRHGKEAADLIQGSLDFYKTYFLKKSNLAWAEASEVAQKYLPFLAKYVPQLVEEMRGIADGAKVDFLSILALNTRSEISMGMMDDGCTSVAWQTQEFSTAGQNWDWEDPQKERLVLMHINPSQDEDGHKPKVSQVTEAGIIGKSGINSSGVGVFLNAIRARGINFNGIPIHLALRHALEMSSRLEAVEKLSSLGFGTSGHIMIADISGATSLEFTHVDVVRMEMVDGQIAHTNHFLAKHVVEAPKSVDLPDSVSRMKRIATLLREGNSQLIEELTAREAVEKMLEDEERTSNSNKSKE
ncbi:peptidase C45 acyl-coenzyme A:6-aminopenicillanic acid acyl-transferase [Penicillium macrosclerotiorum]|uniref:peptidase C45 acyl-coenzyme A:6-aminopenicillanic acid acyl-transferase n=1 Tax=Penicillium macrosclerotiorum TaxID=303699 RepID=UPI002547062D|nr:peptidase C45 acyl-coenzyme A:6-aminopenicillanic acid acyl-transferase [Penicillium macrosclerotiorum]KAJ5666943.1 peptidase C45 acyl-coenzyme A:6-aminopenicillanic acid acyl-transferase [Penicillium macrosclerotiorum]